MLAAFRGGGGFKTSSILENFSVMNERSEAKAGDTCILNLDQHQPNVLTSRDYTLEVKFSLPAK